MSLGVLWQEITAHCFLIWLIFTIHTPHYEQVAFEVPEGWEWTTLEEILELVSGQDFPPEKYNVNVAGIPYIIGASNIENEQLVINRWTDLD